MIDWKNEDNTFGVANATEKMLLQLKQYTGYQSKVFHTVK